MTSPSTTAAQGVRSRWSPAVPFTLADLAVTVVQLAVAAPVPGLDRFEGNAFRARLVAYPAMMLVVPALWWLADRRRRHRPDRAHQPDPTYPSDGPDRRDDTARGPGTSRGRRSAG